MLDLYIFAFVYLGMKKRNKMRKLKSKQINLFPSGIKKQKYYWRHMPKEVKLQRIKSFEQIRKSGGTYRDVAIAWGLSPNSAGKVPYDIWGYCDEGIVSKEEAKKIKLI
jgi:hypothetical protein